MNHLVERPVTRLGTLDYMAPEVLVCPDKHLPTDNKHRSDLWYGANVDSWAVGVLAYELAVGRPPFGMVSLMWHYWIRKLLCRIAYLGPQRLLPMLQV